MPNMDQGFGAMLNLYTMRWRVKEQTISNLYGGMQRFLRMFSCVYSISTSRLVRAHWDASRMAKIKEAYRVIAKEDLARRVRSETSGAYRTLLVALVDGIDWMNK
jgi:hypothetical protein